MVEDKEQKAHIEFLKSLLISQRDKLNKLTETSEPEDDVVKSMLETIQAIEAKIKQEESWY